MSNTEGLVYGLKLSTVVPGRATGEGKVQELSSIDLAMKLHYLKGLYFFTAHNNAAATDGETSRFITISDLKNHHMFDWLQTYFMTCGRVRTSPEDGARPVIKLNDAGIRVVEAQASKSVEEWLGMDNFASLNDHLIYTHVLGPDLGFTPLVFIQVTWFNCGGISVGLSWSHILGDAFSASAFMNDLGHYLKGHQNPPKVLGLPNPLKGPSSLSINRVNPVADSWAVQNNTKMGTHSFQLTREQLGELHGTRVGEGQCFSVISAMLWKWVAKMRKDNEPNVATVIRPKSKSIDRKEVGPYNGLMIWTVKAQSKVSTTEVGELEGLIGASVEEESAIVVYGGRLTFVDYEEAQIYGFELKGRRPVYASYSVGGVGDEGAVIVLPGPGPGPGQPTKLVILILPQHEIQHLQRELIQICPSIAQCL